MSVTGHGSCFIIEYSLIFIPPISFLEGLHACRSCGSSNANHNNSIDWTLFSSTKMDRVTSDVVAPSPWTIVGCQNGKYKTNICDIWDGHSCLSKAMSAMQVWDYLKKLKIEILVERLVAFDSWFYYFHSTAFWLYYSFSWQWDDHPAIMAVGVVDGTSEAIFQTLMSLGPSRSE